MSTDAELVIGALGNLARDVRSDPGVDPAYAQHALDLADDLRDGRTAVQSSHLLAQARGIAVELEQELAAVRSLVLALLAEPAEQPGTSAERIVAWIAAHDRLDRWAHGGEL